ncbi:MAG: outer membrane protein transport protein [Kiritimatiellia bacterium]
MPIIFLAASLAGITTAHGAGFALYEMSARGNALGGALVGITGDASANYFNPANLTATDGLHVMVGASMIGPEVTVHTRVPTAFGAADLSTDNDKSWWTPPHAYASMQVAEKTWVGVGIFSPFGLGSVFDENWVGRYNSYKAIIETVEVNPNVAYKLDDHLSVAVGLQIMTLDLTLKRKLPNSAVPGGPDMNFELEGDSVGYGGNAALSYRVSDNFGFGLTYRSEVQQTVKGDATLTAFGSDFGTDAEGTVVLPAATTLGGNYTTGKLMLGGSVTYTEWSSFDELRVKFANPAILGRAESVTEKDWNNVFRYAAGAEYRLNPGVALRCSYVFDEDPVPNRHADYLVPSNDRHLFGFGMGFALGRCNLDLGYTYLMFKDREDVQARPAEGVYPSEFKDGFCHIVSASLSTVF